MKQAPAAQEPVWWVDPDARAQLVKKFGGEADGEDVSDETFPFTADALDLAVEYAGADLYGVTNRLGRIVAAALALAHETDGAVVLDDETVDDYAIA